LSEAKSYISELTTIRFFLATLVVFTHCNQNLKQMSIFWFENSGLFTNGGFAVECFFILSGFLLTYLSRLEFLRNGFIDIKKFFIRRSLRILPLYFLAVFLGYISLGLLFPALMGKRYLEFSILDGLPMHLSLLPNLVIAKYPSGVGSLYSLWSIGVEEQFYLCFPFLMTFVFRARFPIMILLFLATLYFCVYSMIIHATWNEPYLLFRNFCYTLKFHDMLLGAACGLIYLHYPKELGIVFGNALVQLISVFFFAWAVLSPFESRLVPLQAISFCFLILLLAIHPFRFLSEKLKLLHYFGIISFGIYIYHPLVSYPLRYTIEKSSFVFSIIEYSPFIYYIVELFLSITLAHFSFKYFESRFYHLKSRFLH
jgi:peptidoglycan/LPS O-acetylase OafA/YrhL